MTIKQIGSISGNPPTYRDVVLQINDRTSSTREELIEIKNIASVAEGLVKLLLI